MKLQQGQIWKTEESYLRIVRLERLNVDYKEMKTVDTKDGWHRSATKKEFCRLIQDARLIDPNEKSTDPLDQLPPERLKRPGRIR